MGDTTLDVLHEIIQATMGWAGHHGHSFEVNGNLYGPPDLEFSSDQIDEATARVDNVLPHEMDRGFYVYDFGDHWVHELLVETFLPVAIDLGRYPIVTDGRNACPVEDCGGIDGYYELLEVLDDREHPGNREMLEWLGRKYNPESFDVDEANRALRALARSTRPHG